MFTDEIIKEIKSYVYIYSDPETNEPFYVGKGMGNRCFSHLEDSADTNKTQKIRQLAEKGLKPKIELIRFGLTESEAALIEATLIDLLWGKLTNLVRGYDSSTSGRITVEEIIQMYSATEVQIKPEHKVMLIKINQTYRDNMTADELYEAVRGIWRINRARAEAVQYVLAVVHGVIKEVYRVIAWDPANSTPYKYRVIDPSIAAVRKEFQGEIAEAAVRDFYKGKAVRNYTKQTQSSVLYVNC